MSEGGESKSRRAHPCEAKGSAPAKAEGKRGTADPSPAEAGFGPDSQHRGAKSADDSKSKGNGRVCWTKVQRYTGNGESVSQSQTRNSRSLTAEAVRDDSKSKRKRQTAKTERRYFGYPDRIALRMTRRGSG